MQEIWKDIENYEGIYQVSNLGRIRSLERITYDTIRKYKKHIMPRILKLCILNTGYYNVNLTKKGKQKTYHVHKVVAKTFIPNPNNLPCINHIDGNKLNNDVRNLEWCTVSHNSKEAIRLGLSKIDGRLKRWNNKYGKEHNRSKKIYQIDIKTNKIINVFYGSSEASRVTGINASNINSCCNHSVKYKNGKKWITRTAGGYKWEFA